jgi:hypothetical protein
MRSLRDSKRGLGQPPSRHALCRGATVSTEWPGSGRRASESQRAASAPLPHRAQGDIFNLPHKLESYAIFLGRAQWGEGAGAVDVLLLTLISSMVLASGKRGQPMHAAVRGGAAAATCQRAAKEPPAPLPRTRISQGWQGRRGARGAGRGARGAGRQKRAPRGGGVRGAGQPALERPCQPWDQRSKGPPHHAGYRVPRCLKEPPGATPHQPLVASSDCPALVIATSQRQGWPRTFAPRPDPPSA